MAVAPYLEQYRLREWFDGMVCNSGADVYGFDPPSHVKNYYLSAESVKLILREFQDYDFLTVGFHMGRRLIASKESPEVRTLLKRNAHYVFGRPQDVSIGEAPKCLLLFDRKDRKKAEAVFAVHPLAGVRWVVTEPNICEFLHVENSKASGAARLLERHRLSLEDSLVFGDADNDAEIMAGAGISVCMKNGSLGMREIADYVTRKTNNENGVMDFLARHEDLLLGE